MPDRANSNREMPSSPEPELPKQLIVPKFEAKTSRRGPLSPEPSTSKEMESSKQGYDVDVDVTEEEEENVGTLASLPKSNRRFLDTQYGMRKDGEQLMRVDYPVFIDPDDNITIEGTTFRGSEEL